MIAAFKILCGVALGFAIRAVVIGERSTLPPQMTARHRRQWRRERLDINPALRRHR